MEQERLKWIEGYEGMYLITSFGRVYSVVRRDRFSRISGGGEMLPASTPTGYKFVRLCKKGNGKQFYIHQLVARAFIPNPENKNCVDHIDNNKSNNNVENLRWVTHKENMENTITRMRMINESAKYISQEGADNPFSRRVAVYTLDGELVGEYDSGGQAKRELGLPPNLEISRVCNGKRPHTHGYVFKYLSEAKMKIEKRSDGFYKMKPILQLDLDGNIISEFASISEAAKKLGLIASNLGRAAKGMYKTCGGYKWRFK